MYAKKYLREYPPEQGTHEKKEESETKFICTVLFCGKTKIEIINTQKSQNTVWPVLMCVFGICTPACALSGWHYFIHYYYQYVHIHIYTEEATVFEMKTNSTITDPWLLMETKKKNIQTLHTFCVVSQFLCCFFSFVSIR